MPPEKLLELSRTEGLVRDWALNAMLWSGSEQVHADLISRINSGEIPQLLKEGKLSNGELLLYNSTNLSNEFRQEVFDNVVKHLSDAPHLRNDYLTSLIMEEVAGDHQAMEVLLKKPPADVASVAKLQQIAEDSSYKLSDKAKEVLSKVDEKLKSAARDFAADEPRVEAEQKPKSEAKIDRPALPSIGESDTLRTSDPLAPKKLENMSKTELIRIATELQKVANTDAVTDLPNRKAFDTALQRELAGAERKPDAPVSMLLLDLNSFKAANDLHGHGGGDQVLKKIGEMLQSESRKYDLVARTGGDEFSLVLPNTTAEQAQILANRLREHVKVQISTQDGQVKLNPAGHPVPKDSNPVTVSLSIGASTSRPGVTVEEMTKTADQAMYADKKRQKAGRGLPLQDSAQTANRTDQSTATRARQESLLSRDAGLTDRQASRTAAETQGPGKEARIGKTFEGKGGEGVEGPHSLWTKDPLTGRGLETLSRTELIDLAGRLQQTAHTDLVTGLPNRKAFDTTLNREMAAFERHPDKPFSVLLVDLNSFKAANDLHGHTSGDRVLKSIGEMLQTESRKYDLVARTGGDEFCVLLPDTTAKQAEAIAERLRNAVKVDVSAESGKVTVEPSSHNNPKGENPVTVSLSIGTATAEPGVKGEDLVKAADSRMYEDKKRQKAGRETVEAKHKESAIDSAGQAHENGTHEREPVEQPRARGDAAEGLPRSLDRPITEHDVSQLEKHLEARNLSREQIEQVIREQTIPESKPERLEDLTKRLKDPRQEQGTYSEVKPEFKGLSPAELGERVKQWSEEFKQLHNTEPTHADFNEHFLSEGQPREMRLYNVEGHDGLTIAIPEDHAKTLDRVRELRIQTEHGATEQDRVLARWELRLSEEYRTAVLPEDVIGTLKELPDNGELVTQIVLDNKRNPDDAWHTIEYNQRKNGDFHSHFDSAAVAHIETGQITVYPGANQFPGGMGELVSHEWAHLLEKVANQRSAFDAASHVEGMGQEKGDFGFYHRDYARYNNHEDWAVHIGEVFLAKDIAGLDALHAMINEVRDSDSKFKVLTMARAVEAQLVEAERTGNKSENHDQIKARVDEVVKQLLPPAQEALEHRLTSDRVALTEVDQLNLASIVTAIDKNGAARLVELASKATNPEVAMTLLQHAKVEFNGKIPVDQLKLLAGSESALRYVGHSELATSGDPASPLAKQAKEKLLDGVATGEIARLWKEGKLEGKEVLQKALSLAENSEAKMKRFEQVTRDLQNSPTERDLFLVATVRAENELSARAMGILESNPPRSQSNIMNAVQSASIYLEGDLGMRMRQLDMKLRTVSNDDVKLVLNLFRPENHAPFAESLKDHNGFAREWKSGQYDTPELLIGQIWKNEAFSAEQKVDLLRKVSANLNDSPTLQQRLLTEVARDVENGASLRHAAMQQLLLNPPSDPSVLSKVKQLAIRDADPAVQGFARIAQIESAEKRLQVLRKLATSAPDPAAARLYETAATSLDQRISTGRLLKSTMNEPALQDKALQQLKPDRKSNIGQLWQEGKIDGKDVMSHLITLAPAEKQGSALADAVASLKDSPRLRNEMLVEVAARAGADNPRLAAEALRQLTPDAVKDARTASALIELSRSSANADTRAQAKQVLLASEKPQPAHEPPAAHEPQAAKQGSNSDIRVPRVDREGQAGEQAREAQMQRTTADEEMARLVKAAESETDPAKVKEAVQKLIQLDDESTAAGLMQLAKGDSAANPYALEQLAAYASDPEKIGLIAKRLQDGDVAKWWKEGKVDGARVFDAMAFSGMPPSEMADLFHKTLEQLKERPDLQAKLASTVADTRQNYLQMAEDSFPNEVRHAAVEKLIDASPLDLKQRLEKIGLDSDPKIAKTVKEALDRIYDTPAQLKPGDPSTPKLLEGKHLDDFAKSALKLEWNEPGGTAERYKRFNKDSAAHAIETSNFVDLADWQVGDRTHENLRDLFDKPDQMRKLLEDKPELLSEYNKLHAAEQQLGEERKHFDQIAESRKQQLQEELNKVTDKLGLPRTELKIEADLPDARGTYAAGRNELTLRADLIMTDKRPSKDALGTLMHELGHHDQADLVTRSVLDTLKVAEKTLTDTQRMDAKKLFFERTGQTLTDGFLDAVSRVRDGKYLNSNETARAERLAEAFKDRSTTFATEREAKDAARFLQKQVKLLQLDTPMVIVTGNDLQDAVRMQRLFGMEQAPNHLQELKAQIDAAGKAGDLAKASELEGQFKKALIDTLSLRGLKIEQQAHKAYKQRFHEQETHAIGARERYLADFHGQDAPSSGEPIKSKEPASDTKDRTAQTKEADDRFVKDKLQEAIQTKQLSRSEATELAATYEEGFLNRQSVEKLLSLPADLRQDLQMFMPAFDDSFTPKGLNEFLKMSPEHLERFASQSSYASALVDGLNEGTVKANHIEKLLDLSREHRDFAESALAHDLKPPREASFSKIMDQPIDAVRKTIDEHLEIARTAKSELHNEKLMKELSDGLVQLGQQWNDGFSRQDSNYQEIQKSGRDLAQKEREFKQTLKSMGIELTDKELASPGTVNMLLQFRPDLAGQHKELTQAREQHEQLRQPLDKAMKARAESIQSYIADFSARHPELKLPELSVAIEKDLKSLGAYKPGQSEIVLREDHVVYGLTPNQIGTVAEEVAHAAQNRLIVEKYLQDAGVAPGEKPTAEQLKQISERHEKDSGWKLSDNLLRDVLANRDSELTREEGMHADALNRSLRDATKVARQREVIANNIERLNEHLEGLYGDNAAEKASQLLSEARQDSLEHDKLFGQKEVPPAVRDAYEKAGRGEPIDEASVKALREHIIDRNKQLEEESHKLYRAQTHERQAGEVNDQAISLSKDAWLNTLTPQERAFYEYIMDSRTMRDAGVTSASTDGRMKGGTDSPQEGKQTSHDRAQSESDIRFKELEKEAQKRKQYTEEVIRQQTIPERPPERLEDLTAQLDQYQGIRYESAKQLRSEFEKLSPTQLADRLEKLGINNYADYDKLALEQGRSREMRVYKVKGHENLEIVMSEEHAKKLDDVRKLRMIQENASDPADRAQAMELLKRPEFHNTILPEDVVQHLNNLPDRGQAVQRIVLSDRPSKDNGWHTQEFYRKQLGDKKTSFEALGDAGLQGGKRTITIYPTDAEGVKNLGNLINHEWAHLLELKNPVLGKVMDAATKFEAEGKQFGEKPYFHNPYAGYNARENWAVHMEKAFLAKGMDGLDSFHAMLSSVKGGSSQYKVLEMAWQLDRVLDQAEKRGQKSADHDFIKARVAEAQKQLHPHLLDQVKGDYPPSAALRLIARMGNESHAAELMKMAADPAHKEAAAALRETAQRMLDRRSRQELERPARESAPRQADIHPSVDAPASSGRNVTEAQKSESEIAAQRRAAATNVAERLQQEGHLALLVGGSVRDEILGRMPKDYDLATSATPEQVQAIFAGKAEKTERDTAPVRVFVNSVPTEVTTLRLEANEKTSLLTRPTEESLRLDAQRRDLTNSAIYKDPISGKIYDFHGGQEDIQKGIIRSIGDPDRRVQEDPYRMLRAVRMASELGAKLDPALESAISRNASRVNGVEGAERKGESRPLSEQAVPKDKVRDELLKILGSKEPLVGLDLLMSTGLMKELLPEVAALNTAKEEQTTAAQAQQNAWEHTKKVVEILNRQGQPPEVVLAGLLHAVGSNQASSSEAASQAETAARMARNIANRLEFAPQRANRLTSTLRQQELMHKGDTMTTGQLSRLLENKNISDSIALQDADAQARAGRDGTKSLKPFYDQKLNELKTQGDETQRLGAKPLITGKVLQELGHKPGEKFKSMLNEAKEAQAEGRFKTPEEAKDWAKSKFGDLTKPSQDMKPGEGTRSVQKLRNMFNQLDAVTTRADAQAEEILSRMKGDRDDA
jgi:poly(A) polymerase